MSDHHASAGQALDDLGAFLDRVVPRGEGYICTTSKAADGNMQHRFFPRTPEGLTQAAEYARQTAAKGVDVWHANALYREPTRRTQENVAALKCFWVDIDVKREGDKKQAGAVYADRGAALAWLKDLVAATGLLNPNLIVDSGYGYHAYWIVENPMAPAEWRPYADALKSALLVHGATLDAGISADSARILRPPETFNLKDPAHPAPVKVLGQLEDYPNELVFKALRPFLKNTTVVSADVVPFPGRPSQVFANRKATLNEAAKGASRDFKDLPDDQKNAVVRGITTDPRFIPLADRDGATWRDLMWAGAHAAQLGATEAEDAFREWSRTSEKQYDADVFESVWRRFDPNKKITVGTLLKAAKEVGIDWRQLANGLVTTVVATPATTVVNGQPTTTAGWALTAIPAWLTPDQALQIMNSTLDFAHDWGGEAMLVQKHPDGQVTATDEKQIRKSLANRRVKTTKEDGRIEYIKLATWWLEHERRSEVDQVLFSPEGFRVSPHKRTLNLWRGFSRQARKGSWRLMRRHLYFVICKRDKAKFKFLVRWLAHAVQHPETAPGSVVVMQSTAEGSGKSTVLEWMRQIFGEHAVLLSTPEDLLGEFNDHLEDKCFIGLNEPTFPGDHRAAGKFKSMVTEPEWWLNGKWRKRRRVPNIAHIALATNREWAIPAGSRARRWFMVDVSEDRVGDIKYFNALNAESSGGGIEAFLDALLQVDLSGFTGRNPHKTAALLEQQLRGANTMTRWAFDCVSAAAFQLTGDLTARSSPAQQLTGFSARRDGAELYRDYTMWCGAMRERPEARVEFGRWLARLGCRAQHSNGRSYHDIPDINAFAAAVFRAAGFSA